MIKKILYASLLSTLPLLASISYRSSTAFPTLDEIQSTISPSGPSDFYSYVGVGFSTIAIVPCGANISIGSRYAKNPIPIGIDQSINFSSTFASQYIFAKTLVPVYFSPRNIANSFYAGPFATIGYNNQLDDPFNKNLPPEKSYLLVNGFTFGKNIDHHLKISFWQISANLRKYKLTGIQTKTSIWPTLSFQYGIGF
jgi:hypothetical protein